MGYARVTEAAFWARFTPEPNTGCWLWTGCVNNDGYGVATFKGLRHKAHRLAYIFAKGKIKRGLSVCHSCDNGDLGCGNPDHLWLGTHRENLQDAAAKGRMATGSRSGRYTHPESYKVAHGGRSKLTKAQVLRIRANMKRPQVLWADLAREFHVSKATISRIVCGHGYRSVR